MASGARDPSDPSDDHRFWRRSPATRFPEPVPGWGVIVLWEKPPPVFPNGGFLSLRTEILRLGTREGVAPDSHPGHFANPGSIPGIVEERSPRFGNPVWQGVSPSGRGVLPVDSNPHLGTG